MRTLSAYFYLWQQLLVCFNASSEECHRILRHLLQLPLKWLSSWFSLTGCVQTPCCLSWQCAHSFSMTALNTISLTFISIPWEMAASFVFFLGVTKIRKHEISGGEEILKDRLNNELQILFSQKGIAICCTTETLCAVMTPGL